MLSFPRKVLFGLGVSLALSCTGLKGLVSPVWATEGSILGIHILNPAEATSATQLLQSSQQPDVWHYVTIPLSLRDLNQKDEWQKFLRTAKQQHLIPIVRLTSKFENGVWSVPTKKEVTDLISFLSALEWPTDERYIIVFNEVNHAKEWGGSIDPVAYTETLRFTSDWAHSENKNYKVLPAAMDLAAPNGGETREAFAYLNSMYQANNRIFSYVDYWNSHSYPNPGFTGAPTDTGKMSLKGFQNELAFLKDKTGRDFDTFITETGWSASFNNRYKLAAYYDYAVEHVWSDPHIKGVTPFVLQGDPGPFASFTFLDRNGEPTLQYQAYQTALKKLAAK